MSMARAGVGASMRLDYRGDINLEGMGCGSSVSQVSDSLKEGAFRPIRLLEIEGEADPNCADGRLFLFGETKTRRVVLECDPPNNTARPLSTRTRIPNPKISFDPLELMYEQSQEIFHLGSFGFAALPPYNAMLCLHIQRPLIFLCGGRDFDGYQVKNEAFFYSIVDEPLKRVQSEILLPGEQSERTQLRSKYSGNKFQKLPSMNKRRYAHTGTFHAKSKSLFVLGGYNEKNEAVASCERFGIMENCWKEMGAMGSARAEASCFQLGSKIYVFGGRSSARKLPKKIEFYDLESNCWEVLNFKLHRGIDRATIFSLNPNEIIIAGGLAHSGASKSVVKVDIVAQTYVWDSELNFSYNSMKAVMADNQMVVFGGEKDTCEKYSGQLWSTSVFELRKTVDLEEMELFSSSTQSVIVKYKNVSQPKWECKPSEVVLFGNEEYPCLLIYDMQKEYFKKSPVPMTLKLKSHMAIVEYDKNQFLLAGGSDRRQRKDSRSVLLYDFNTGTATETVKLPHKKYDFSICHHAKNIYVFGGCCVSENSSLKSCEKYSLQNQNWQILPSLRRARRKAMSEVISDNKIAIFGGLHQDLAQSIEIYHIKQKMFDTFEPDYELPSKLIIGYAHPSEEKLFIFGYHQQEGYTLSEIDFIVKPEENRGQPVHEDLQTIEITHPSPKVEKEMEIQEELPINKIHESNQNYFSGQAFKIVAVQPIPIEIGKREHQKSERSPSNAVEDEDDSFELENIQFQKTEMEETHRNGQIISHEMNRQESDAIMQEHNGEIETKIMEINPSKLIEPSPSRSKDNEPNKTSKTKPIAWLQPTETYKSVKRRGQILFFGANSCIVYDTCSFVHNELKAINNTRISLDKIM